MYMSYTEIKWTFQKVNFQNHLDFIPFDQTLEISNLCQKILLFYRSLLHGFYLFHKIFTSIVFQFTNLKTLIFSFYFCPYQFSLPSAHFHQLHSRNKHKQCHFVLSILLLSTVRKIWFMVQQEINNFIEDNGKEIL